MDDLLEFARHNAPPPAWIGPKGGAAFAFRAVSLIGRVAGGFYRIHGVVGRRRQSVPSDIQSLSDHILRDIGMTRSGILFDQLSVKARRDATRYVRENRVRTLLNI